MKDKKPTKKELATHTKDLEEQLTRLKNRLNGQVFKKTKHGYRLDQLSEGAQQLGRRVSELEQQLAGLGNVQEELAVKWQELGRDAAIESENNKSQKLVGKKHLKEKLGKLKASVSNLSLIQKQIGKTLSGLQNDISRVGSVRDDLKLETDQLRAQVRNLEENSSRLSVNQSAQEARTRELEGLLAELTLKQEQLSSEDKREVDKVPQQPDETISPLTEQLLQQLSEHTSEDNGRHKEVDRRLHELANRVGDLGGNFNHLKQDVADQRQQREYLKQELDLRLQQLEARISGIDNLRERLDVLSNNEQVPVLNQKLSGVEAEVNRLSEAGDFLQESFQGLGGLELNLTSRLDDIQRQLQEHIGRSREFEEAVDRLSGEFGDLVGNLQKQLDQADLHQQGKIEALQQQQELLAERELNFDSHRQEIDGQLDRIEESITTERERISQLEENFSRASDERAAEALELEQGRLLQLELQSRFEDLNEDFANQTEQSDSLSARVEEQAGKMQALSTRVDEQAEQQSSLTKESLSNGKSNQFALIALLLFGLLGGTALYFSNAGKIAESEQRITQNLASAESGFVTQEGLAERLKAFQSSLAGNSEKPTETATELTPKSLWERQNGLEQQLADFEVKLNLLAGDAQNNIVPDDDSGKQQALELERIQLEIKRIDSALAQLNSESSTNAGETRLAAVESSLGKALDQLGGRISQLESRPNPEPERAAAIEQALNKSSEQLKADMEQLGGRISQLETRPNPESERIASIEQALNKSSEQLKAGMEQLGGRISQLETRPNPESERIAAIEQALNKSSEQLKAGMEQLGDQQNAIGKIERNLSDTGTAIEKRLSALETENAGTNEMYSQLQSQVQVLAASRKASEQKIALSGSNVSADIWLAAADARRYTIQLAGSRSKSSLIAFASEHSIQSQAAYFRTVHEGRDWFILLYGPYSGFADAAKALENLPPSLNRYSPWIRRIPEDAEFVAR